MTGYIVLLFEMLSLTANRLLKLYMSVKAAVNHPGVNLPEIRCVFRLLLNEDEVSVVIIFAGWQNILSKRSFSLCPIDSSE
jgi:hypothetical protein